MQSFKGAFPDLRIDIRSQVADEERVVAEFVAVGTHTGPLETPAGAVAATGRKVTFTVCEVWDIKAGRLIGLRNYQDMGSILRQLGVM
jgi:predicted ester cyclase